MSGMLAALGQQAVTRLSLPDRLLQAEALIRRGGGPAALEPFGAEAPLRILLDDLRRSADLNLIGCFGVRYDMLRLLRNLAALREHAAHSPRCSPRRSRRRSSSPGCRAAAPPSCTSSWRPTPRTAFPRSGRPSSRCRAKRERHAGAPIATMDRQLAAFERMAPDFRAVHPIDAVSPQECSEITAHVFRSYRFETTHHIPAYRAWLRAADHAPAYRFHRRFLQHLQHVDGRPRRWVLKCPDHVFTLDALARGLSRCPPRLPASRPGRGAGLGRRADRHPAPALRREPRQAGDRAAGRRRLAAGHRRRCCAPMPSDLSPRTASCTSASAT